MNKSLHSFNKITTSIILISGFIENIFFFSPFNFFASIVLIYGWLLIKTFVLTSYNLKTYPVTFLMFLGLSMFYFVLPMPLTILEFKPVTYNLNVPLLTFFHHFLFITIIVFTFLLYTRLSRGKNVFRSILVKTDFYVIPTNKIIWITAILGLFASFYNYFIFDLWQKSVTDRNFLYYLNTILSGYIWMPIIIPFSKFRYGTFSDNKKSIKTIILYSIFVFIIAIASNWRTILFSGIIILVSLFVFGVLLNFYQLKKIITPKSLIIIVGLTLLTTGPLVDLGYAMVIVRSERSKLSSISFLNKTIDVYKDKKLLLKFKSLKRSDNGTHFSGVKTWNEDYLHNIILNRFVNLKISDNCIFYANKIGYQNPKMQAELINQLKAFTPNILLKQANINLSKKIETSRYSIGDYLYSLAINDDSVKGSAVISSMPGIGLAIFGYWYILVLVPIFLIIFTMFDSFVNIKNRRIVFSYFFFLMLTITVNYFNDRHVFTFELRYILRTYFETVIIFIILMKVIRIFAQFLPNNKVRIKRKLTT